MALNAHPPDERLVISQVEPRAPAGIDRTVDSQLLITVVSWNTREMLRACLSSIFAGLGSLKANVHVVDNASADGSPDMVRVELPEVRLIANSQNVGFASACNQSWRSATGRYWMLLNSDTELRPGALEALVAFADRHPRAGLVTARIVGEDGRPQHCAQPSPSILLTVLEALRVHRLVPHKWRALVWLGPYFGYDRPARLGWTWGTALLARRDAVAEVGTLSEDFFMYGEDLEWSLRMRRFGWQVWFCPDAEVLHHGGASSRQLWTDDASKQRLMLANIYKAIEISRGRVYGRLLLAVTVAVLACEVPLQWVMRRPDAEPRAKLRTYLDLLKRPRPSPSAAP